MKKVSTAAAKATRNSQDQKLTIGLDLTRSGSPFRKAAIFRSQRLEEVLYPNAA